MSRRRKARRRLIKAGVVLSVLFLTLWLASRMWTIGYVTYNQQYTNGCLKETLVGIDIRGGGLLVDLMLSPPMSCSRPAGTLRSESHWTFERRAKRTNPGTANAVQTNQPSGTVTSSPAGAGGNAGVWTEVVVVFPPKYPWWHWGNLKPVHISDDRGMGTRRPNSFDRCVVVEIWALFLLCAIPTALLWWRERRLRRAGVCLECGYNLTGNVSGICPECGTAIAEEGKTA
jgi:hypothetical protein